jgi:restriction endonuclease S subunit
MLDVQDSLEFDIARQYLMAYPVEELAKHNQLATLRKIIESGARCPRVRLGEYLRLNTDRINPGDAPDTRFRVLGVSNTDGVFLNETKPGAEIRQTYYRVKPNEFCYNPYRVNVGSIGLCEFDYDNQIISGAYNVFGTDESELLPQYLLALFRSPQFLAYVNDKAHGGVRMNFKFEYLEDWEIPKPETSDQAGLADRARRLFDTERAMTLLRGAWRLALPTVSGHEVSVGELVSRGIIQIGSGDFLPAKAHADGPFPVYGGNGVQGHHTLSNTNPPSISVGRVGALCGCVHFHVQPCWITDNAFRITADENVVLTEYLAVILRHADLNQFCKLAAQPSINQAMVKAIAFALPPVDQQRTALDEIKRQSAVFDQLNVFQRALKSELDAAVVHFWSQND